MAGELPDDVKATLSILDQPQPTTPAKLKPTRTMDDIALPIRAPRADDVQQTLSILDGDTPPETNSEPNQRDVEADVLKLALRKGVKSNTALAAHRKNVARKLNINPALVTTQAEESAFYQDHDPTDLQKNYPALAKYLQVDGNAELVGKNIDPLKEVETFYRRAVQDPEIMLSKGVVAAASTIVGLGDLVSLGKAGKYVEDQGIDFKKIQSVLTDLYTPEAQAALKKVAEAKGFTGTLAAAAQNPSAVGLMIGESLPQMYLGRVFGGALKAAFPSISFGTAGAAGEGITMAGGSAEQIRRETDTGELTAGQTALSVGVGVIGTGLSKFGNVLATKLGIEDVDAAMVAGKLLTRLEDSGVPKQLAVRLIGGAAVEGGVEEMPQSITEQIAQNVALGRPWDEGVPENAAIGLVTGGAMGAAAQVGAVKGKVPTTTEETPAEKQARTTVQNSILRTAAAVNAEEQRNALKEWGKRVSADNPLRKESPQSFKEFVRTMADENGAIKEVFVDAKLLNETLGQAGIDKDKLAADMPEVAESLDEALVTNGEVRIPIEDYATHIVGTPVESAIIDHLRTTPDGMTYAESQVFFQQQQDDFIKQAEALVNLNEPVLTRKEFAAQAPDGVQYKDYLAAHKNKVEAFATDLQEVHDKLLAGLESTGRFPRSISKVYAIPFREFYATNAARMGMLPSELYASLPLNFEQISAGDILNQSPEYKGHLVNSGGLQGHSLGELYPYMVVGRQNGYQLLNGATGELYPLRPDVKSAIADRGTGKATFADFNTKNVKGIMQKTDWMIMSAWNPNNQTQSRAKNDKAHARLLAELKKLGLQHEVVMGRYGMDETESPSVLILGANYKTQLRLVREYQQESVLVNRGLLYQDGSINVPTSKVQVFKTGEKALAKTGAYTRVPSTGTIFSMDFDFNGKHKYQPNELGRYFQSELQQPDSLSLVGVHYSKEQRSALEGKYFGTGLPGVERDRLSAATDKRILNRVDFYVDTGDGVVPESGLGNVRHEIPLQNIYDASKNERGFRVPSTWTGMNDFESQVLDAGYDGYFVEQRVGNKKQGRVVVLGQAAESIPTGTENGQRRNEGLLRSTAGQDTGAREPDGSLQGLPRKIGEFNAKHYRKAEEVTRKYMAEAGLPYNPPNTYAKVDKARAKRIADAFDQMLHDPQNPEVKAAYAALAKETAAQYKAVIDSGLKVEFIDFNKTGDPYEGNPRKMTEDVINNNHMWVFSTREGFGSDADFNPQDNLLLNETEFEISGKKALVNDLFRVVHDYFGHVKEGVGFRAEGEENAWRAHMSMFSPLAGRALTVETRGQNSWVNFGPYAEHNRTASAADTHYADQKTGLLPEWVSAEGVNDEPQILNQSAFYSALQREIPSISKIADKNGMVKADQALSWVEARQKEGKFKLEEVEAVGLKDWLQAMEGKVSVADIENFVAENGVQIEEKLLSGEVGQGLVWEAIDPPEGDGFSEAYEATFNLNDQYGSVDRVGIAYAPEADGWWAFYRGEIVGEDLTSRGAAEEAAINAASGGMQQGGETKFEQYKLPGGENYRELLLTLPDTQERQRAAMNADYRYLSDSVKERLNGHAGFNLYDARDQGKLTPEESARLAAIDAEADRIEELPKPFKSAHYDEKNILAHVRFDDRTNPATGQKILFIEEIQSDWAQEGRKKGFVQDLTRAEKAKLEALIAERKSVFNEMKLHVDDTDETVFNELNIRHKKLGAEIEALQNKPAEGTPAAPFVQNTKSWVALAVKRMLRYAAENGYDQIAWTTGEQQAARYDLIKQISRITYTKRDGKFTYNAFSVDGDRLVSMKMGATAEEVQDNLGKEILDKMVNDEGKRTEHGRELSGLDLKVGGEGMLAFYDKLLPQVVSDVAKKLGGGKVGLANLSGLPKNILRTVEGTDGKLRVFHENAGMYLKNPDTGSWTESESRAATFDSYADAQVALGKHELPVSPGQIAEQPALDITPEMRDKIMSGLPLFQGQRAGFDPSTFTMSLLKGADLSSVIHEGAHFYLEALADLAGRDNAPRQIKDDFRTTLEWFGITGNEAGVPRGPLLDQKAFHGSTHDHDRFDSSKIGTGEGAQAYGYGHYFAESRDVAEWYKKKLTEDRLVSINNASIYTVSGEYVVQGIFEYADGSSRQSPWLDEKELSNLIGEKESKKIFEDASNGKYLEDEDLDVISTGKLYEVELVPKQDEYLLWDKPLSEQSEKVLRILQKNDLPYRGNVHAASFLYSNLSNKLGSQEKASAYLHSLGIRGIKYLDGTSRSKGEGSYNYVIFDDKDITIVHKYDQGGSTPSVIVDDTLLSIAEKDTKSASGVFKCDLENDQQGVVPGRLTNINASLKRGNYTLADITKSWNQTRDYLRSRYGDTVMLYRVNPPESERNPDTQVVYMGDESLAKRFETTTRKVEAYQVPVDNIVALNARPSGYYEFIVKRPTERQSPPGQLPPGRTPEEIWRSMTLDQKRPYHEQWAQSYERYTMEGKAPSVEMQSVFSRFREWMLSVYKSMKDFLAQNPLAGKLNDDIRGVFDRLIASEDKIYQAEEARGYAALFGSAAEAGLSEKEFEDYQNLGKLASVRAIDEMNARSIRDMRWLSNAKDKAIKKLQAEANTKRAAIKAQVSDEVDAMPLNRARNFLTKGEFIDESGVRRESETKFKLNEAEVKAVSNGQVPDNIKGMIAPDGIGLELAAKLLGYQSPETLIGDLTNGESRDVTIQGLTDQRMLEQYGDLTDDKAIERAAEKAIHNDARARFMATGLKILSKTELSAAQLNRAAKMAAEATIAKKKIRALTPGQFTRAEAKANREAIENVARDPQKAVDAQRAALLNNRLAKAALEATEDVDSILKYFKKFESQGVRKAIGIDQADQIDDLLQSVDRDKSTPLREIDKRQALADWVAEQEADGFEPVLDPILAEQIKTKHYKDMTVDELRMLRDTVKQIEHVGRLKQTLLTEMGRADFRARVEEAENSIRDNANRTVEERGTPTDVAGLTGQWVRQMFASHRKFSSFIREMDGGRDGGVMWRLLSKNMNAAGDSEVEMRRASSEALSDLFKGFTQDKTPLNLYAKRMKIPGTDIAMTQEQRIMFGMNWGNEGNRQRLLDGGITGKRALSINDANAILGTLTKPEWDFVQGVWDHIATYKDQIAALERKITGVEPEWVEPVEIKTKHGTYRGGYFPAKYDIELSSRSESLEAAVDMRMGMKGAFNTAATRSGYTKARSEAVMNRPLLLSYNVIANHISEVTHRLAWQPWLIDANRVLKALDAPIREHYGAEVLREMRNTVIDIAAGDVGARTPMERAINHLRTGSTIVGMGWRFSTAFLQPSGLAQSWARIGGRWMTKGIAETFKNLNSASELVNSKSSLMKNRDITMNREVRDVLDRIRTTEGINAVTGSYFSLIGKMQRVVDIPTWLGAYEKALHDMQYEHAVDSEQRAQIESDAVAMADQAVIDSQSGGQIKDLASIQRGHPGLKLFTNFYSYFSATYNLNIEALRRTNFRSPTDVALLAGDLVLLNIIPVLFATALKEMTKGKCGDDLDCLVKSYGYEQAGYMFGQMVLLRDMGSAALVAAGGDQYGYSGPAGLRFFSDLYKAGVQANQGELDWPLFKSVSNTAGVLLHFPMGQVNTTLEGIMAVENGDVEGVSILPALLFGPPKEGK